MSRDKRNLIGFGIALGLGLGVYLLPQSHAFSQSIRVIPDPSEVPGGLSVAGSPSSIVALIFRLVMSLAGAVFLVLLLFGGFTYMTAGGNDDSSAKAKKIMTNALIGLIIILISFPIGIYILRILGINA